MKRYGSFFLSVEPRSDGHDICATERVTSYATFSTTWRENESGFSWVKIFEKAFILIRTTAFCANETIITMENSYLKTVPSTKQNNI